MALKTDTERSEYLSLLADILEEIPYDTDENGVGFDLEEWGKASDEHACGTTVCAMGYAALHPAFQDRGLSMTVCGETVRTIQDYNRKIRDADIGESSVDILLDDECGSWRAVREFWGLSSNEVKRLFSSENYETPSKENVIKRLRHASRFFSGSPDAPKYFCKV